MARQRATNLLNHNMNKKKATAKRRKTNAENRLSSIKKADAGEDNSMYLVMPLGSRKGPKAGAVLKIGEFSQPKEIVP